MSKITKVKARQVFDSRGNPTIEAEVFVKNQSATAICPSGASTGTYEAFEKRDINNKRYLGKSVLNAIGLVNTKISKKLKGQNIHNQEKIDTLKFNYKREDYYVNRACGFLSNIIFTTPALEILDNESIFLGFKILNDTIKNENQAHLAIYH